MNTKSKMKMILNRGASKDKTCPRCLTELREGETGILEALDLPEDQAARLMELGFLPGAPVTAGRSAPSGDPRVFQVDGGEIALRRETAAHLRLRNIQ